MAKVSGSNLLTNATVNLPGKALVRFLERNLPNNVLVFASLGEKVISALMDSGIISGVSSEETPENPYPFMMHLKPAKWNYEDRPTLLEDADLKIYDPALKEWVDIDQTTLARMHEYNLSVSPLTNCVLTAPIPDVIQYRDEDEGFYIGQFVRDEYEGRIHRSKTGSKDDIEDRNYVDPVLKVQSVRNANWSEPMTDEQLCTSVKESFYSVIASVREFVGADILEQVTVELLVKALRDNESSEINEWNGDAGPVTKDSDGKLYLANPNGDPKNNQPQGDDGTNWFGPYDSLAQLIADFIKKDSEGALGGGANGLDEVLDSSQEWEDGKSYKIGDIVYITNPETGERTYYVNTVADNTVKPSDDPASGWTTGKSAQELNDALSDKFDSLIKSIYKLLGLDWPINLGNDKDPFAQIGIDDVTKAVNDAVNKILTDGKYTTEQRVGSLLSQALADGKYVNEQRVVSLLSQALTDGKYTTEQRVKELVCSTICKKIVINGIDPVYTITTGEEITVSANSFAYDDGSPIIGITFTPKWTLPDGTVVNSGTVKFTPSNDGVYNLKLTVKDSNNLETTTNVSVIATAKPQVTLAGAILTAPSSASTSSTDIDASISDPTNGKDPLEYDWEFNGNKIGTTKSIKFDTPNEAGTYTLKCTITDADGNKGVFSQNITVSSISLTGSILTTPASVNVGQTNISASMSKPTNGSEPYTYVWEVDGKLASGGSNGNLAYTAPSTAGSYLVKCTVTDANGNTGVFTQNVTASAVTLSGMNITAPSNATAGKDIIANVSNPTNGSAPYSRVWELNGQNVGTDQTIAITIPNEAGTYTLKCTITDADGNKGAVSQNINVSSEMPIGASFGFSATGGSTLSGLTAILSTTGAVAVDVADGSGSVSGAAKTDSTDSGSIVGTWRLTGTIGKWGGQSVDFSIVNGKRIVNPDRTIVVDGSPFSLNNGGDNSYGIGMKIQGDGSMAVCVGQYANGHTPSINVTITRVL